MIKLTLTKVIASSLIAVSLLALNPIGASAEWRQNSTGWWYAEGRSYATGWKLIDGKYYYFSNNGYMMHNTYIDGYKLGPDGAWVVTTPTASTTSTSTTTNKASKPVLISLLSGLNDRGKCLLSCNYVGNIVDLWNRDDGSGRQRWKLIPVNGLKGVYNIIVSNGVNSNVSYLSSNYDGSKVALYCIDDGSGRQRWRAIPVEHFEKSNITTYLFEVYGGISSNKKYLSCNSDGTQVDLWSEDDGSGRQRWGIQNYEWQPLK